MKNPSAPKTSRERDCLFAALDLIKELRTGTVEARAFSVAFHVLGITFTEETERYNLGWVVPFLELRAETWGFQEHLAGLVACLRDPSAAQKWALLGDAFAYTKDSEGRVRAPGPISVWTIVDRVRGARPCS